MHFNLFAFFLAASIERTAGGDSVSKNSTGIPRNNTSSSIVSTAFNASSFFHSLTATPVLYTANGTTQYLPYSVFPEFYPDPKLPKQQECYTSWSSWCANKGWDGHKYTTLNATITTRVYVYETLNSFGPNITYTECDGIPRLSFLKSATSTATSFVTLTVTRNDARLPQLTFKREEVPWSCRDVGPWGCRKLYEMVNEDIGPGDFDVGMKVLFPPQDVCPLHYDCVPLLNEIILLHWPDNIASRNSCASHGHGTSVTRAWGNSSASVFVTDAITFRGQDIYIRSIDGMNYLDYGRSVLNRTGHPWEPPFDIHDEILGTLNSQPGSIKSRNYLESSVMRGQFTFISPTVYLAHRPITRLLQVRESETKIYFVITSLRPAGIIPLHSTEVFSVYPIAVNEQAERGPGFAKLVAKGSYHPLFQDHAIFNYQMITRPFDFGDLLNPVPASAYFAARFDCFGQQSHCGTITDDSYRPKIRLARKIWQSIYGSIACRDALLVDPPISLHPIGQFDPASVNAPSSPFHSPMDALVSIYTAQPLNQQGGHLADPVLSRHPSPGSSAIPPYPSETGGSIHVPGKGTGSSSGRPQHKNVGGQNLDVSMLDGSSPADTPILGIRPAPVSGILPGLIGGIIGIGFWRDQSWRHPQWSGYNRSSGGSGGGSGGPSGSDRTRPETWSDSDLGEEDPNDKEGETKATPPLVPKKGTSSKSAASHRVWLVSLVLGGAAILL